MDILNKRKWRSWNINHRAREGECLKILTQKKDITSVLKY